MAWPVCETMSIEATTVKPGLSLPRQNAISLSAVGMGLRLWDLAVVAALGALIFFGYVYPRGGFDLYLYGVGVSLAVLLTANMLHLSGVYRETCLKRPAYQLSRVMLSIGAVFVLLLVIAFLTKTSQGFSRVWATSWFVSSAGILVVTRLWLALMLERWRRAGRLDRRTVIAGAGPQGQRLAQSLLRDPDSDTDILAVFDDRTDRVPDNIENIKLVGDFDAMVDFCRDKNVEQVLVALPASAEDRLLTIVGRLRSLPVDVRLCLDLIGFNYRYRSLSHVAGLPFLNLHERPIARADYVLKWIEDKVLASLALLLLSPLMLLVAVAVKLDSPGPVLFRQKRQGFNNDLIEVWKFRTMRHDLVDHDGDRSVTRADSRVTRFGRILRRFSIDELPQLFNVLQGTMSLVGPRPHALGTKAGGRLLDEVVEEYAARHRVKPGITGWAQVNGWRGETDTEEKLRGRVDADLYYIENWSIGLDIYILFRTIYAVFTARNAY